jgi:hypothetical protein
MDGHAPLKKMVLNLITYEEKFDPACIILLRAPR